MFRSTLNQAKAQRPYKQNAPAHCDDKQYITGHIQDVICTQINTLKQPTGPQYIQYNTILGE
jgi:hypothetical protein